MEYLLLGKVSKPHGLKGEVKIFSHTDFASLRYKVGHVVFYLENDEYKPITVNSFHKQTPFDIVSFKEFMDIDKVKCLLNKEIYIKKSDATLPKNYYHFSDLINCDIYSEEKKIGTVKEVRDYPANYCLMCIDKKKKEFMIPFVSAFIKKVDIKNKRIDILLIEGIL